MSTLNYTTYVSQLTTLMAVASSTDAGFTSILPGAIDYAEQRLYRELDLLATRVTDASGAVSSGVRTFALPTVAGTFLVVEQINIWSSAGATSSNATRNPVTFVSRDFIDTIYPSAAVGTGVPEYAAMASNTQVVFGPAPDLGYTVEVIGTQRPTALSSGNSSTILTQMVPDLFIAGSMVFMSGYMRDFGAQADNPQMSQSWETQYKSLFASANVEELRKRYMGPAWTAMTPSPLATPARV